MDPSVVMSDLEHAKSLRAFSVCSSPSAGKRAAVVVKCGVEGIKMVPTVKLNNGYHFPVIGLGTYNVSMPNNLKQ
jgi:hypothetical protein